MSMNELAEHIIYIANESNMPISNIHLQKIMYFAFKKYAQMHQSDSNKLKKEYDEPFLIWAYGPYIESIYYRYSTYGSEPIKEKTKKYAKFDGLDEQIFNDLQKPVYALIIKSQNEKFWIDNSDKIRKWRSDIAYSIDNVLSNK